MTAAAETSRTVPAALELREMRKSYGSVEALRGASLVLRRGEVTAVLGDNGAGKSTLLKIAAGAIIPDSGEILVDGVPSLVTSPEDARSLGIETVYQDLALADTRSAIANVFMARELVRSGPLGWLGVLDRAEMARRVSHEFERLGVPITDVRRPVRNLSGGQRQGVAIARAAMWAKSVVLLDEPTAALGVRQRGTVHDLITAMRERQLAVLLISHDVPEVLRSADTITVMRFGQCVATRRAKDADLRWCVGAMVGETELAE